MMRLLKYIPLCASTNDKILDNLYIGSKASLYDKKFIIDNNISVIYNMAGTDINICNKLCEISYKKNYNVLLHQYNIHDRLLYSDTKLMDHYLNDIVDSIHNDINSGKTVLVICYYAMQRSVTVVLAYLLKYKFNYNLQKSLKFLYTNHVCSFSFGFSNHFSSSIKKFIDQKS